MAERGGDAFDELVDGTTGWGLAGVLADLDVHALSAHALVTAAQACQKLIASAEALRMRVFAELVARPEYASCDYPAHPKAHVDADADAGLGHVHRAIDAAGDEISLALAWSPGRAKHAVAVAAELVDDLPDTLAALEEGRVDAEKAQLVADRTRCLAEPGTRRRVEAAVLPFARTRTRMQLDRRLRQEVIAAAPAAAEQRRRAAASRRRVSRPDITSPGADDGMACLTVYGPAEDLTALWTALDAAARHTRATAAASSKDGRTLDQLRFDVLASLAWTGLDAGHLGCCNPTCANPVRLGKRHGKAAAVQVTVAASTLFGADERPGWLAGFGPVTAEAARRIAAEGPWRRLLTDPATGELLEYGRTVYTPPAELAAFVVARDRTCRFPTCDRDARDADIDHRQPYRQGGETGASNTWALHRGHHVGKTVHGFTVGIGPEGGFSWTTPAGHSYPVQPEPIGPVDPEPPPELEPPPETAGPPEAKPPPGPEPPSF